MSQFFLPNPDDLTRTRGEIVAAQQEALKCKMDNFCQKELAPAIVRANDTLKTEIMFRLPTDIPANEFVKYMDGFNNGVNSTVKYVLTCQENGAITLDWGGQK